MDLDVEAAWTCSRAVLPAMIAQGGGAIVNIASRAFLQDHPALFPLSGRQARAASG